MNTTSRVVGVNRIGIKHSAGDDRGTGRTTEQLRQAATGAVFVWCNGHLGYPRRLAAALSRQDLCIRGPDFFSEMGWLGSRPGMVVVDHAFRAGEWAVSVRAGYDEWASADRVLRQP